MVFRDFHSHQLRKCRVSLSGQLYLVTATTHNRAPLFSDFQLGRIVVTAMRQQAERGLVESLAFVVMPDHFHWLLALNDTTDLSKVLHSVKGFSGYEIGRVPGRNAAPTGPDAPVWQKSFHDHALRKEEDVRAVARYLVMNPVRAGLVSTVWDYPLWDAIWIDGE